MTLRRKLTTEEQAEVEKHKRQAKTASKQREAVERFKTTFFSLTKPHLRMSARFAALSAWICCAPWTPK
ncbi:MAG: hypothetical protein E3J25_05020 [Anaerolineales bacterium]|nr:MAG: hypothetical protein E3J25_05020 [Anaerolineales bacterium]